MQPLNGLLVSVIIEEEMKSGGTVFMGRQINGVSGTVPGHAHCVSVMGSSTEFGASSTEVVLQAQVLSKCFSTS